MGNRLAEGACVICGGPVIEPNEWYTCSQCVKIIRAKVLRTVKNIGQGKKLVVPELVVHKGKK